MISSCATWLQSFSRLPYSGYGGTKFLFDRSISDTYYQFPDFEILDIHLHDETEDDYVSDFQGTIEIRGKLMELPIKTEILGLEIDTEIYDGSFKIDFLIEAPDFTHGIYFYNWPQEDWYLVLRGAFCLFALRVATGKRWR